MQLHTDLTDIPYVDGSADPKQMLDLFVPKVQPGLPNPFPVAVFVHGGVWALGDRKKFENVGKALARRGILTAVLSYRLAPASKYPAQIQDVASAVTWLAAHAAEHGGAPKRIVLIGHSAGAQLVSLIALDERWLRGHPETRHAIAGIIALSGIYDLEEPFGDPGQDTGKDYVARAFGARSPIWHEASPVRHLEPRRNIPFLLVMAERDYAGIRNQTVMMEAAMRNAGWKPELMDIAARDHDSLVSEIGRDRDPTTETIVAFARRVMHPGDKPSR